MICVYKIENKINGRTYVGATVDKRSRFKLHRRTLRQNRHRNKPLQADWNEHGECAFEFVILKELTDATDIRAEEQAFFLSLNPHYNICKHAGSMQGYVHSEESKKKIGESVRLAMAKRKAAGLPGSRLGTGKKKPSESSVARQ